MQHGIPEHDNSFLFKKQTSAVNAYETTQAISLQRASLLFSFRFKITKDFFWRASQDSDRAAPTPRHPVATNSWNVLRNSEITFCVRLTMVDFCKTQIFDYLLFFS